MQENGLFRFDLEQGLALLDGIAYFLEPTQYPGFLHPHSELRQEDFSRHGIGL